MIVENRHVRRVGRLFPRPVRDLVRVPLRSRRSRQERKRFRSALRPTDVFLVGHPRSGNTWLAYMLAVLLENGDPEGRVTVANIGDFVPVIHERDEMICDHEALGDPRIFRNERPNYPDLYPRSVFIVRDPRSTLVSYYHYYKTLAHDADMTLDAFVTSYLADGCIVSFEPRVTRWDQQVLEWTRRAGDRPVAIVRYEDLHHDRGAVLPAIARFCSLPDEGGVLASALERGAFEAMRRDEGLHGVEPQHPPDPPSRGWFFREGRTDGWKAELSPMSSRAIEQAFRPAMQALNYPPSP